MKKGEEGEICVAFTNEITKNVDLSAGESLLYELSICYLYRNGRSLENQLIINIRN